MPNRREKLTAIRNKGLTLRRGKSFLKNNTVGFFLLLKRIKDQILTGSSDEQNGHLGVNKRLNDKIISQRYQIFILVKILVVTRSRVAFVYKCDGEDLFRRRMLRPEHCPGGGEKGSSHSQWKRASRRQWEPHRRGQRGAYLGVPRSHNGGGESRLPRARAMDQTDGLHDVLRGVCRGAGERLALPVPMLQKWWR